MLVARRGAAAESAHQRGGDDEQVGGRASVRAIPRSVVRLEVRDAAYARTSAVVRASIGTSGSAHRARRVEWEVRHAELEILCQAPSGDVVKQEPRFGGHEASHIGGRGEGDRTRTAMVVVAP